MYCSYHKGSLLGPGPNLKVVKQKPSVCVGVYGLPHCSGDTYTICNYVRKLLTVGAYFE